MIDEPGIITIFQYFVSLAGIIGAFFYIHMGNWLQNVLKLGKKCDIAKWDASSKGRQAMFELQFELREYRNPVFLGLIAIVDVLLVVLFIYSKYSADQVPNPSEVVSILAWTYWIFTLLFFITSITIVMFGYWKLYAIDKALQEWKKEQEGNKNKE